MGEQIYIERERERVRKLVQASARVIVYNFSTKDFFVCSVKTRKHIVFGALKTTLRLGDLLKELTRLQKTILSTMVPYSEGIQIKISKGKNA